MTWMVLIDDENTGIFLLKVPPHRNCVICDSPFLIFHLSGSKYVPPHLRNQAGGRQQAESAPSNAPLPQVAAVEEILPKEDTINVEGEMAKVVEVTSVNEVETEAEADTKVVEAEAVDISPRLTVAGMTRVVEVEAAEVTVVDTEEVVAVEVPMVGEGMEDVVLLVAMR